MPTSYASSRTIAAPPEKVWALITDAANFPAWNSTIVSLEGSIKTGQRISLVSTVSPKRAFKLTVTEMDGPRRMVWADGMPLGLFRGTRTYELDATVDGGTRFQMTEVFTGPLAPRSPRRSQT